MFSPAKWWRKRRARLAYEARVRAIRAAEVAVGKLDASDAFHMALDWLCLSDAHPDTMMDVGNMLCREAERRMREISFNRYFGAQSQNGETNG